MSISNKNSSDRHYRSSGKRRKIYISAILDCFDSIVIGHEMDDNMRAELYKRTLVNVYKSFGLVGTIMHSNRGSRYTNERYRDAVRKCDVKQSMNSACGDAATTHAVKV